ncbi:Predicted metal-dependent enzyme of the double-stranded beta helix superfamily [Duganella sp. CF517]|uniref:cysteine dioxygenase family protein n=1 Tax=Duganella sp. CF517 TaxID=1881038 RepID=UPI0008BB7ACA|nr:cysteine dioxygenase [Duganella sp. CF517]SEN18335.1 Predicted metal-dependent enzyme of the double-stranded beta helix superfamily [Duganella sp. CF517]
MSTSPGFETPARLRHFVEALDALLEQGPEADETQIVAQGSKLLRDLVAHDDWLPQQAALPDPQYYRQYLLYRDPAARFSVVSFVWGPGQSTPIHNHTVWGLAGLLRGAEISQDYRRRADGVLEKVGQPQRLETGVVTAVSPTLGDIHQVFNAYDDRISIGIHVYGADIGAVDRSVFTPEGAVKPFRSGYANAA